MTENSEQEHEHSKNDAQADGDGAEDYAGQREPIAGLRAVGVPDLGCGR